MPVSIHSVSNQFVFNLPSDFVPKELEDKFMKLLRKNRSPYDSVIEYLDASIKSITIPSMSIPYSTQKIKRGKETHWRSVTNVYDAIVQQVDVTFNSVDSHMNYVMLRQALINNYLNPNPENNYTSPLTAIMVDIHRNPIIAYTFRSVLPISISDLQLSYSDQRADEKSFTLQFQYSWFDIDFLIDDSELTTMEEALNIKSDNPTPTPILAINSSTNE